MIPPKAPTVEKIQPTQTPQIIPIIHDGLTAPGIPIKPGSAFGSISPLPVPCGVWAMASSNLPASATDADIRVIVTLASISKLIIIQISRFMKSPSLIELAIINPQRAAQQLIHAYSYGSEGLSSQVGTELMSHKYDTKCNTCNSQVKVAHSSFLPYLNIKITKYRCTKSIIFQKTKTAAL